MSDGAQPYTARPSLYRNPGERVPSWACACDLPSYRKHKEPQDCLSQRDIAAWRVRHPEATCSERTARALCWMEISFGPRNAQASRLQRLEVIIDGVFSGGNKVEPK